MLSVLHFIAHQWLFKKKEKETNKKHKNDFLKNRVSTVSQHILKQSILAHIYLISDIKYILKRFSNFFLIQTFWQICPVTSASERKKRIISFTSAILTNKKKKKKILKSVHIVFSAVLADKL